MVTSITPAVCGGNRIGIWSVSAAAFVFGGALGGVTMGGLTGMLGSLLQSHAGFSERLSLGVLAGSALGYAWHIEGRLRLPTLPIERQVPRDLRGRMPMPLVAFLFSIQLGSGLLTRVTTPLIYVLLIAIVVFGDPVVGAGLLGCFGIARAGSTIIQCGKAKTFEDTICRVDNLIGFESHVRVIETYALLVLASVLCIALITTG